MKTFCEYSIDQVNPRHYLCKRFFPELPVERNWFGELIREVISVDGALFPKEEQTLFTKEQAMERFGFLLTAFKYGVPPHAGLAYGLDRVAMWMAGAESIRDVMAFPKNQNAECLVSDAPNIVDQEQLDELGISLKNE